MDFFLSRYRNLTVLLVVIAGQLLLIAYQVKTNNDVPLIRFWAITAVTPTEQVLELVRRYTWGFVEDYFVLLGVRGENEKLKHENGDLKMENHYLKSELATADRARALSVFKAHTQSTTVAARVIGNGIGANSKSVFVDRGSASGVESGMAVVTPDGIVGKVVYAYPTASLVMLITDPTFAAGVVSQKNRVHGTLKGQGHTECLVDYIQNEEPVDAGEWFFTSGDDRIFPKGFPVGKVSAARNGKTFKEVFLTPSGMQGGVEEVLIVLHGVHEQIPEGEIASPGYQLLQPPADSAQGSSEDVPPSYLATDADRLRQIYKQAGEAQKHVFGEGTPGSKPPDFTKIPTIRGALPAGSPAAAPASPQPSAASKSPGSGAAAPDAQSAKTSSPSKPSEAPKAAPATAAAPKTKQPSARVTISEPTDDEAASPEALPPVLKPERTNPEPVDTRPRIQTPPSR